MSEWDEQTGAESEEPDVLGHKKVADEPSDGEGFERKKKLIDEGIAEGGDDDVIAHKK